MKERPPLYPPPIELRPVIKDADPSGLQHVQERARAHNVQDVVVLGGGGATLPSILGVLEELRRGGVIGEQNVAEVGTSAGSIAGALWELIGLDDPDYWHDTVKPIASMRGFAEPWNMLSEGAKSPLAIRKLNFLRYFNHNIKPNIPHEPTLPAKPAVSAAVATKAVGLQPHLYHNGHWENEDGTVRPEDLLRCVERSCSVPGIFTSEKDPHIGLALDGGVRFGLHCPVDVARHMLGPEGGRIVAIEPLSNLPRGIYWEQPESDPNVQILHIAVNQNTSLRTRAQKLFVFDPTAYELGQEMGAEAARMYQKSL